jgi:hypothetical protein
LLGRGGWYCFSAMWHRVMEKSERAVCGAVYWSRLTLVYPK